MRKRIFSVLLVMCLCLSPIGALAYDYHYPDNWTALTIGQTEIEENKHYLINGSGNITTDGASVENYNIFYENNTLTLNNAVLTSGIYAPGGTTINLLGTNVSGSEDNKISIGIQTFSSGSITITGTGYYDVYTKNEGIATVYADNGNSRSDIIIESGTLDMHGASISTRYGGLTITGSAKVTAGALSTGGNPNPDNGGDEAQIARDIIINGNAKVTAESISNLQAIKIGENAVVNVTNDSGIAISGERGIEISDNATVNATGYGGALNSFNGAISIGGTVTATNTEVPTTSAAGTTGSAAVSTVGSITVTGQLTISSKFAGMWTTGTGNIIIDGGTVEMENIPYGLLTRMGSASSGGDISITNEASVTITGAAMGTFPQGASTLTVDSSTVEIEATDWGLYWPGPMTLKNSTVICTTNYKAIGTNNAISYQYLDGYIFLAGDTADAAQVIGQSEQTAHLNDKYVKITPVTVPVTGITLNQTALSLTVGGTAQLTATVTPENASNKAVTWASSAESVATVDASGNVTAIGPGTATITAKAGDKTAECIVTVSYPYLPPVNPSYLISLPEMANGTVTASPAAAQQGATVTLTVTPDEGWELAELTVTSKDGTEVELTDKGDGKYTFTMPGRAVTVEAVFVEIEEELQPWDNNPFTDIQDEAWYYEAVQYVYENGLMTGTSTTTFSPDAATSRGQIVTILWRMAGCPVVNYLMDFDDVNPTVYYGEAVRWATSVGIVVGYGNGNFGPDDPITREQFAVMLYNYAVYSGMDVVTLQENLNVFSDSESISAYAVQALNWAVGEGIITGKGNQILDPKGQATRAQAAAMLQRFLED